MLLLFKDAPILLWKFVKCSLIIKFPFILQKIYLHTENKNSTKISKINYGRCKIVCKNKLYDKA